MCASKEFLWRGLRKRACMSIGGMRVFFGLRWNVAAAKDERVSDTKIKVTERVNVMFSR